MSKFDALLRSIRDINHIQEEFLPLHAPIFNDREREAVLDTISSTFVSSVGTYVDRFEDMLCEITGARHAIACVNGLLRVALVLAGTIQRSGSDTVLIVYRNCNAICHTRARHDLKCQSRTLRLSVSFRHSGMNIMLFL